MAKEKIISLVIPALTETQLVPLFVERKTPPPVPAMRLLPLTARARIVLLVKPALADVHVVPLLVERKTPPL